MRKIRMFNMISVDGFFAGEDGNIDWHTVDDEFNAFAIENMSSVDTYIFGRVTYQLFASYWPEAIKDPASNDEERHIGKTINDARKIVFSKTLKDVSGWAGSELYSDIDPAEVKKWKAQDGKDLIIFGSGSIVCQFTELGLIDEYGFMVSPVILGAGKPLFTGLDMSLKLKLLSAREFKSNGNVLLTYAAK